MICHGLVCPGHLDGCERNEGIVAGRIISRTAEQYKQQTGQNNLVKSHPISSRGKNQVMQNSMVQNLLQAQNSGTKVLFMPKRHNSRISNKEIAAKSLGRQRSIILHITCIRAGKYKKAGLDTLPF